MLEKLNVYKTIKTIKQTSNKKIELVYNEIDHFYYIKRELKNYDLITYQRLKDHPHPGLVKVVDLFEIEDTLILIEKYINGPTLEEVLLNEDLTYHQIIQIMDDLCKTLTFMHQLNPPLIHRDIKPENIFYYRQQAIIFDFDISREYDNKKNKDTCLMGSMGYAAPEQYGFSQSDTRSDIYALGIILNVLFTKKLPQDKLYEGDEVKIIKKATSMDPKNRYESVEDFRRALHKQQPINKDYRLPGFRHKKWTNRIIAILYFIFSIAMASSMELTNSSPRELLASRIFLGIWLIFLPLFIFNYLGLKNTTLFSQSRNKIKQILGLIVTLFFWLCICVILGSMF